VVAVAVLGSGLAFLDSTVVNVALPESAGLCVVGGLIAFLTVRRAAVVGPVVQPSVSHACADAAVCERVAS